MGGRSVERVGGQGRCEHRSEVFVKIPKRKLLLLFFFFWGGGGGESGVQGRCEQRSEVF